MPEPQQPEPTTCPKCGKTRTPGFEACARCGLVFALWKSDTAVPFTPLDGRGEELWHKLQDHWSESSLHDEFLKHCLQANTLAAAGRLYRERLDQNPGDAVATHMQGQVLARAALGLTLSKSTPRQPVTRNGWFWVVVLIAMALGIGAGLFWRRWR